MPERRPRRAVGDRVPLHPPQRRLWFLAGYDPGSAAYNVALELELDEAVEAARLATALRGLVERHDVLRQVVRADDAGEPFAELVAVPDDLLTVLDGDHDEVDATLRERARAPFDLAAGPALRCLLARTTGRAPVLQLVAHHVATDAWSEQVLVRDLEALYAGEQLPGRCSTPTSPASASTRRTTTPAGGPPVSIRRPRPWPCRPTGRGRPSRRWRAPRCRCVSTSRPSPPLPAAPGPRRRRCCSPPPAPCCTGRSVSTT